MVADRLFRCLDCQQYVVFPSNLQPTDRSGLPHQPFSFDFNSLQPTTSDQSDLIQSVFSPSNFPDSFSSFPSESSHIPFPEVIDIPMTHSCLDSYNLSSDASTMETAQKDETALLGLEVDQLKDMVQTLQKR
jgi:hypothetical protein